MKNKTETRQDRCKLRRKRVEVGDQSRETDKTNVIWATRAEKHYNQKNVLMSRSEHRRRERSPYFIEIVYNPRLSILLLIEPNQLHFRDGRGEMGGEGEGGDIPAKKTPIIHLVYQYLYDVST